MTPPAEVTLEQRQAAYARAELRAARAAEAYVDARAAGATSGRPFDEMDSAQAELRQAKRRLEQTQRRLAKRKVRA